MNMLQILKGVLSGRNEFASGGLLLMIIGEVSVWLRAMPESLGHWIVGQATMMITVKDPFVRVFGEREPHLTKSAAVPEPMFSRCRVGNGSFSNSSWTTL
jgi:hypothetical protein